MDPRDIKVTVNGEAHRVSSAMTVRDLLTHLGVRGHAAVERNREIVPRAEHGVTALADGDELEVVQLVGGG